MAYLRVYMAQSRGTLPGRGQRAGDPFFGGLIARAGSFLLPKAGKLVSRGVSKVFGKKAGGVQIPAGIVKAGRIAGGFGGSVAAGVVGTKLASPGGMFGGMGVRRRYRRINAGNTKALNRAFRRVKAFGKLASKAGYVKRQSGRSFSKARKR